MKSNQGCDGFLLVDKPSGITSSKLVQLIRKTFNLNKIGHTGTLDPLATGGVKKTKRKKKRVVPTTSS